jgi:hypothetical protein
MKVRADFNGLFAASEGGLILCLSHSDTAANELDEPVQLSSGMLLTAFDENMENGRRDELIANGVVVESPEWLRCSGSRWALQIDERGCYRESDIERV